MTSTPMQELRKGALRPNTADKSVTLQADIAAMLRDAKKCDCNNWDIKDLAHDLIVVIRERVLQEIQSYARHFIR